MGARIRESGTENQRFESDGGRSKSLAMNFFRASLSQRTLLAILLLTGLTLSVAQTAPKPPTSGTPRRAAATRKLYPPVLVQGGGALFRQNCSFCHGRDAAGGENGPDLTSSKLVTADVDGDKIGVVVRNGRPDKGMPRFELSERQIAGLVAFLHTQQNQVVTKKGGRRRVEVADLQTGDVGAGKEYFNGTGGCATCHSPTGDLAGLASRYQGLELEEQMLYPKDAKSKVTVTLPSGEAVTGTLKYLDEFTVGLTDSTGTYRSWRTRDVKYDVDAPVNAHVELFSKYTDADIHNLMAYLQTLR
jgi:cytochrome c oxidase cbb3-type subunit 3